MTPSSPTPKELSKDDGRTFEESSSTLSATLPTDKRISVLCCLASVIRKEVTSVEPGEEQVVTPAAAFTSAPLARKAHLGRARQVRGTPVQQGEPQTGARRHTAENQSQSHQDKRSRDSCLLLERSLTWKAWLLPGSLGGSALAAEAGGAGPAGERGRQGAADAGQAEEAYPEREA